MADSALLWSSALTALSALPLDLSKYEILGEVGHGGMATVYRARDRRLGREVALKVIHRHLRENPEVARRFVSEAMAVAKVKHPNIVEVYDVSGDDEPERYLVVEFVDGQTLRQLLSERAPLPAEVAAAIALEVSRALAQAHRQGVVHRDVKPENVLLRRDDAPRSDEPEPARVKLTDFGIAKLLDAQGVTCTGQVLGSPAHMAPEQIEGGDVDARSDVFGLGVLLYEMLTGVLPFEGKNPAQVLRRVLEGSFVPAERVRPEVGGRYGQIVGRALAHAPGDRFPTAGAFGEAIEQELLRLGVTDARAEIARYLDDPSHYEAAHRQSLPDVLARTAAAARQHGDVVLSASDFNRALAYRPDDTVLLAEVAGIARRGRRRRRLVRSALGAGTLCLIATAAFGARWLLVREEGEQRVETQPRVEAPRPPPEKAAIEAGEPATPEGPPPVEEKPPSKPSRPPLISKPPSRPELPGVRQVRTPVVGPQNAKVRIDGKLVSWFATHELTFGPHVFEFLPPNSECCEAPPPQTVQIVEGEGAQMVRGVIAFRPATLRLAAPAGSQASCGVGGMLAADQAKQIPMDRPERRLTCTIFPPTGASGQPKRIDVDLRPGRTFTLTGS